MKKTIPVNSNFSHWEGNIEVEGTEEELKEQEKYQKELEEEK